MKVSELYLIRIQLLILVLLLFSHISFAGNTENSRIETELTSLLNKKGLSQDYITCIVQDAEGFIWVGTPSGLFKFDGNAYSPVSIGGEQNQTPHIYSLFKDNAGDIWIFTSYGVFIYRAAQGVTEALYENQPWGIVKSIYQQNDSIFWMGAINSDLIQYNKKENNYKTFQFPGKQTLSVIMPFDENLLFLGFNFSGGVCFNVNTQQVEDISLDLIMANAKIKSGITTNTGNNVVVSDKGIFQIKPDGTATVLGEGETNGLKTPQRILTLLELNDSILWLGTDGQGLVEYNFNTNRFSKVEIQESLLVLTITSLYKSNEGLVWVGTKEEGLCLYDPNRTRYKHWNYEKGNTTGLSYNSVLCMSELKNGDIFIGLDWGGANILDISKKKLIHLDEKVLGTNIVTSVVQDKNKDLWLGTYMQGLKYFQVDDKNNLLKKKIPVDFAKKSSFTSIQMDRFVKKSFVECILVDHKSNIWFGTATWGIFIYDIEQNKIQYLNEQVKGGLPAPELITELHESSDSSIMIGSFFGLFKYDRTSKKIEEVRLPYTEESNLHISDIIETSKKELLVATKHGVWKIDASEKDTVHLTIRDGLLSNRISAILQDDLNRLWFTTARGISLFDQDFRHIKNFDDADGIVGGFNDNVAIKARNGILYFGGAKGIYAFKQHDIKINTFVPPVLITDFKIHDSETVDVFHSINIHDKNEVTLKYQQNVFTIDFIALNYTLPEKNTYSYKLEGYDKYWINMVGRNSATYTNIPPGNYVFKLKAANNDGVWNETGSSLAIVIKPPWYRSIPAYILWATLIIGIILLINRYILVQLRLKDALKIEKADRLKQIEINQNKLQFFTDITHELRAPLSLILGPVENLLKNEEPYTKKYEQLKLVSKHSNRLYKLINQILEFRKVEHSAKELTVSRHDIVSIVKGICESYQDLAKEKNISLTFHSKFEKLFLWIDEGMVEIIFHNLLSNAVKFTPKNGTIDLVIRVKSSQQNAEIIVTDSGVGIENENLERIFDQFYQVKNDLTAKQGTGIGLALSKSLVEMHSGEIDVKSTPGKGSKFKVCFKLGRTHFNLNPLQPTVTLPDTIIAEKETEESHKTEIVNKPIESDKDRIKHSVLIVEDDDDLRQYMVSELKHTFKVYTAIDGLEGFSKVLELSPDIVVSDIQMPQMSGLELCKKIKNNFETSHIPVVLLTALGEENVHKKGLEIGADDYLIKPFNMELLIIKIRNILQTRQKLIERFKTEEVIKLSEAGITMGDEEFINKAIELIHAHISDPNFKIEQLSGELGMSRRLVFTKIKSVTGLSPSDFVRNIKLKYAAKLLNNSTLTVSEIAFAVGFTSVNHFRDRFKMQFGITPSAYVKEQKGKVEDDK